MPVNTVKELAIDLGRLLDSNQAENIVVFDVIGLTSIADYFVIATGKNERHLKALGRAVDGRVKDLDKTVIGKEGAPESGWVLVDTGDVLVHLFDSDRRPLYNLELLWGDAKELKLPQD